MEDKSYGEFLSSVRKHPVLYNTRLEEYDNIDVKNYAWAQVAAETNTTVKECYQNWTKLRNTYEMQIALNNLRIRPEDYRVLDELIVELPRKHSRLSDNLAYVAESRGIVDNTDVVDANKSARIDESVSESAGTEEAPDGCLLSYIRQKRDEFRNPRRQFWLSLLPEVESLNDAQMRIFRREVTNLLNRIIKRNVSSSIQDGDPQSEFADVVSHE